MKRKLLSISIVVLICISLDVSAQKKDFTYAQLFQGATSDVSKSLPNITNWWDDDHYLEMRNDETDGKKKLMSIDVKTGTAVPYAGKSEEVSAPAISNFPQDAKNVTYSPDKKYAAY